MKVILVILSVVIASSSGSKLPFAQEKDLANIQSRIIHGYAAEKGQAPYIVGLSFKQQKNSENYFDCGGSIIGNSWILTAAHCMENMGLVKISYGSTEYMKGHIAEVGSENFVQHPYYYGGNSPNDIGLIRTSYVQFSKLINKIKLADGDNSYEGLWSTACGWGQTHNAKYSESLQCASLHVINNVECNQFWSISGSDLCVSTLGGKSTCSGDSGGPLVTPDGTRLIGVSSFGNKPCQDKPAVFTRVSAYLDWIRDNTGIE